MSEEKIEAAPEEGVPIGEEDLRALSAWADETNDTNALRAAFLSALNAIDCFPERIEGSGLWRCSEHTEPWPCRYGDIAESAGLVRSVRYLVEE